MTRWKAARVWCALVGLLLTPAIALAQGGGMPGMPDMPGMDHAEQAMPMGPLGIPMGRMGSGTTWIPDAVSLPSRSKMAGAWELMLHGFAFAQYNKQGGDRGDSQLGSLNWAMLMASRDLAGGRLQLRTMLSLDPVTVTSAGYPLLAQTGESHDGEPLHDRQHPHDFWMELAMLYERAVTSSLGVSFYAAPSGEPALGPVAFMHRPSAMDDPVAPLAHHWQDATHISFGVLTAGVFGRRWKLEGSWFNGREPNDERWDFDRIVLDSWSGRLTVNPSVEWSLSAGYGSLESPEVLHPDESMRRITAAVLHGRKLGADGQWASTLVWGANSHGESARWTHGMVFDSEAVLDVHHTVFGRAELVQKSAEDLVLPASGSMDPDATFRVAALSLGFIREVGRLFGVTGGLGVRGTVNVLPDELVPFYGSRRPLGGLIFFRVRPFQEAASMPGM
jgi:hypothetical protein